LIEILQKDIKAKQSNEVNMLLSFIKQTPFFAEKHIQNKDLYELAELMNYEYYGKGDYIFEKGDENENMYIVIEG